MPQREDIRRLILSHQRVLQKLKEQQAILGINTPAHILIEIENNEASLAALESRLQALLEIEDQAPAPATDSPSPLHPKGGHSFQIGNIQAQNVTIGGNQNLSGNMDFNLDFSEHNDPAGAAEDAAYLSGQDNSDPDADTSLADFQSALLAIRSHLDQVTQNIGALPAAGPAEKEELIRLVQELKRQLSQVTADRAADAGKIAKRVESLVKELDEPKPDPELINMMAVSLKKAAQPMAGTMPAVLTLTSQIATHVLKLAA